MDNNIIVHFLIWLGGFLGGLLDNDLRGKRSSFLKKEVMMTSKNGGQL
jgi:hypothetical protein